MGCRFYTRSYPTLLEQSGGDCWTLDIDIKASRFGRAGQHHTISLLDCAAVFEGSEFDYVLCNGVFGYGINTLEDQINSFTAMAKILKPGGRLLLGWNTDRVADPLSSKITERWFSSSDWSGLSARLACAGTTHVYDFFVKRV